jgi:hypothetical protein
MKLKIREKIDKTSPEWKETIQELEKAVLDFIEKEYKELLSSGELSGYRIYIGQSGLI